MEDNWNETIGNLADEAYYREPAVIIFHADCMDILPRLQMVNLILTDPPYGIDINKSNRLSVSRGFGNEEWDNKKISNEAIEKLFNISKNQIVWGGNYYNLLPTKCFLIWDKQNDGRDFADCEFAWTSFESVARIFRKRPMNMDGGKVHPTQKPLELFKWILTNYSQEGNLVCDPYMGSGTTLIACKALKQFGIGIEISEKYCDIAVERLKQEILI